MHVHQTHTLTMYKCVQCSAAGKEFYVCRDGAYKANNGGVDVRSCFAYHNHNPLPSMRARRA